LLSFILIIRFVCSKEESMKKLICVLIMVAGLAFFTSTASAQNPTPPKDREWVMKLGKALTLERTCRDQYTADSEKLNISMPYRVVLPQVEDHIQALTDLLNARGLSAGEQPKSPVQTKSIQQAYRLAVKMGQDLIAHYEWLVRNAEDRDAAATINAILAQTRRHLMLFEHGLRSGRMGAEMGPGGVTR
jgi:hypothetical protein